MHHLSSLINSIDVVKKMSKSSDRGYLKDKTALHVGCKTTFLGTSDEYKSVKLESICLVQDISVQEMVIILGTSSRK